MGAVSTRGVCPRPALSLPPSAMLSGSQRSPAGRPLRPPTRHPLPGPRSLLEPRPRAGRLPSVPAPVSDASASRSGRPAPPHRPAAAPPAAPASPPIVTGLRRHTTIRHAPLVPPSRRRATAAHQLRPPRPRRRSAPFVGTLRSVSPTARAPLRSPRRSAACPSPGPALPLRRPTRVSRLPLAHSPSAALRRLPSPGLALHLCGESFHSPPFARRASGRANVRAPSRAAPALRPVSSVSQIPPDRRSSPYVSPP